MSRDKKPAVYVAIALSALIVLPFLLLLLSKMASCRGSSTGADSGLKPVPVVVGSAGDFEVRELAVRAERLLNGPLAEGTRKGDVELDAVLDLKKDYDRAGKALDAGDVNKARVRYAELIAAAEGLLVDVELADQARAMDAQVVEQLRALTYLKAVYAESYAEATATYNTGAQQLAVSAYGDAVKSYEMASALLGDLEARAVQQIQTLLEQGAYTLERFDLEGARAAYEAVLEIVPENEAALRGIERVEALAEIEADVRRIEALESEGELEAALALVEELLPRYPGNSVLPVKRADLQRQITARAFAALVAQAAEAEAAGALADAIALLEQALELQQDPAVVAQLEALRAQYKAAQLERLLTQAYAALKAGQYAAARDQYREAVELAPESKEARTGYEKASSLHLANIRYAQNLDDAAKFLKQGRFPRAAKFFNQAMAARPSVVSATLQALEKTIRAELDAQSQEVAVRIVSDNRTYVSLIGVLPPQRLKERELTLFPDVYKLKGTRPGYRTVELELRIDATQADREWVIKCTEKQ